VHTLQWNPGNKRWNVLFSTETASTQLGSFARGQDAVDLVNALNGGQPATVHDEKPGWLGVTPGLSDAELLKQLQGDDPAKPPA
jgi:hypothetical protein